MSDFYTQDKRSIAVTTAAGKDVLLLDRFSGKDGVSQDFRFVLSMLSEVAAGNPSKIKPHDLVGTSMTVRIELGDPITGEKSGERFFTGLCERFVQEDQDDLFASYTAVIVPWFSFLEYSTNCRIFQDKTAPDIIKAVVSDRGYSSQVETEFYNTYTSRAYTVQYLETDRHFVSRIMESEGMFYYYKHTNGNHVMVITDSTAGYHDLPNGAHFRYTPSTGIEMQEDSIRSWRIEEEMHAGLWSHRDYHHEMPSSTLDSSTPSNDVSAAGKNLEVFNFTGGHSKKFNAAGSSGGIRPEGSRLSLIRMQKEEAFHTVLSGWSTGRAFTSGYRISVKGGFAEGPYFLLEIKHEVNQSPSYGSEAQPRGRYKNSFRAIPAATQYSHPAEHHRPAIVGLQTARVIDESPSGQTEEIWPDKYGRVRVRFPWDREAQYGCWLRVVQPWAGKMWGHQWIPRVGDEVAVSFLDGDPDCPVVMGGIFNSDNMPVFTLPDNKTQSGILTHSSSGGDSSTFNMLRFEDKMSSEEVYFQAQKDLNSLIKHAETRKVGDNRTSNIHANDTRIVETGDDTITVQQGNRTITVKQNITVESQSGNLKLNVDQGTLTEFAQGQISITSPTGITLTCGSSKISMTPSEITITQGGTTIDLTSAMATHTSGLIKLNC